MKTRLIVAILLTLIVIPTAVSAAANRPGPYASGFIGVSIPQSTGVTTTDFVTNNTFNDQASFNPGIFIGGTGGYDFGMIRLEGEMSYKNAEIKNITEQSTGYQFRNPDGNLGAFAMMVNSFIDLHNDSPITPYLGGGIGFAVLHLSNTYGTDTRSNSRLLLYPEGNDTVFAYQVGAGLDIAINRMFSLDVGYRYFNTERASFGRDWLTSSGIRYESHNVAIGFRVRY